MKKIIFTSLLLLIVRSGFTQVTIQPTLSSTGLVQKDQLWNLVVVNAGNINYDCRLKLILQDRLTGQEIFTATSSQFNLPSGVKQVNINTVNPVQYNYLTGNQQAGFHSLIPVGAYSACYILTSVSKDANIAEECISFDAEPLSPPILMFPVDSSRLEAAPTQFSWVPPTPVAMFEKLRYEFLVTEILQGQNAGEAIQQNLPVYNPGNLSANALNYPGSVTPFEKDKWYAWQVIARDDRQYAGKSDVWVFKIGSEPDSKPSPQDTYLLLQANIKATYRLNKKELHLKYFSHLKDYKGQITFSDDKGNVIRTDNLKIKQGENYFDFQLTRQFKSNTVYQVLLTDTENRSHSLTFRLN